MNLHKQASIILVILLLASANAFADTCYDPNYGYYDCTPGYYSPNVDQSFMEGAFFGMVIGGFNNDDGYYEHHRNWEGRGGRGGGGGHHGGNNWGGRHH